jgi:polyphosphate kinase 2 (PPK2 family)
MWRQMLFLPERGNIAIFNRSYYEEVLIVRVHPKILRGESLGDTRDTTHVWKGRFKSMVEFEQHLERNGTRVIKFFLHLSKGEQRRRFLDRIEDRDKNWKFNTGDIEERKFWNDYMRAYEECLGATSRAHAPWYVVPADDKHNARLIVSQAIIDLLTSLKLRYPTVDAERRRELQEIRRQLE